MRGSDSSHQYESDTATAETSHARTSASGTSGQTSVREPTLEELEEKRDKDRFIYWNEIKCVGYKKMAFSKSKDKMVMKYFCDSGKIKPHLVIGERSIKYLRQKCFSKMEEHRNNMKLSEAISRFNQSHHDEEDFPLIESEEGDESSREETPS